MTWRIGVDIGGTFTDLAVMDDTSGRIGAAKTLTTPRVFVAGALEAPAAAMHTYGIVPDEFGLLRHTTTVVTNALLAAKGARGDLRVVDARPPFVFRLVDSAWARNEHFCSLRSVDPASRPADTRCKGQSSITHEGDRTMANGQPIVQGGVNVASSNTTLAAPAVATGTNPTAFSAFGPRAGVGLFGTAAPLGPNLLSDDTGVIGQAQTTGVFGSSDGGFLNDDDGNPLVVGAGVAGRSGNSGAGVHGAATAGWGILGQDPRGVGVQGISASGLGVVGTSATAFGVRGSSGTSVGVSGVSQTAQGVFGQSTSSAGVAGTSSSGSGVHGRSVAGVGVYGDSSQSMGVYGSATGQPGVRGDSDSLYGVFGTSTTGRGVHGWSTNGPAGVSGYSANSAAVLGVSVMGYGLLAGSQRGIGVMGRQTSGQIGSGAGVVGYAETGVGVAAMSQSNVSLYARSATNLAARFDGDVEVRGGFRVIGGPKAAVVRHKDGTHRQLYCMESPESWFEDFGEARVRKGTCNVDLPADFAALVDTSDYQVFLTPYAPAPFYVSRRTARSFEIRIMPDAKVAAKSALRCGYRIVARRKDIKAARLAKVKLADVPFTAPKLDRRALQPELQPKPVKARLRDPKHQPMRAVPPPPKVPHVEMLRASRSRRSHDPG